MLNHDLILAAAEQAVNASSPVGATLIQRKVRVGYATAAQLLFALEDIGVLAPSNSGRHEVLATSFDRDAVKAATDTAVAEGKFKLDGEPCLACR